MTPADGRLPQPDRRRRPAPLRRGAAEPQDAGESPAPPVSSGSLTAEHVVRLQRTAGNSAVTAALHGGERARDPLQVQRLEPAQVQRSVLSDRLAGVWRDQGRDAFFRELALVRNSDPDVSAFIERTLTGADLRRARVVLGTDRPLTDSQRNALHTLLVSRLSSAETLYAAACQQVHERIQAERAAATELAVALITIGITYVVPGLGGAITRMVTNIPASAAAGTQAVALGILPRAGAIASTLGEAGKRAAPPVVRAALAASPRDLLNAMIQGFAVAKDSIVSDVATKIQDRQALPDEDLWVAVANWDPVERTIAGYATQITGFYDRWREQVDTIGPLQHGRRSTLERDRPFTYQTGVVWTRHATGEYLTLARVTDGRMSFLRFVDADLREMALARAQTSQPRGVQTLPWDPRSISGLPTDPPATAARRN
ncbi:hypothetical protein GCM10022204_23540 [Microlunatus aurantiacus]|uniref:Uncharacterized protein n=1 Tax=Microlunatus aurantiacus TaxID=446786 RepID=A0ABP7DGE1_9ACTN